jgi:hypothetical protein
VAESYKRLGAVDVAATTNTVLYTVPTGKAAIISSLMICNRGAAKISFRTAHVDGSIGDLANEDYMYYELQVNSHDSFVATLGITMAAGDTLVVRSDMANVNFIAWGSETDVT